MFIDNLIKKKVNRKKSNFIKCGRKSILCVLSFFLFLTNLFSQDFPLQTKISILQIVDHPALNATRDGIRDGLLQVGFTEGKDLILQIQSAQGNPAMAAQIAQKFVSDGATIIVALGTTAAQAAKSAARGSKTVVVFSSITDPLSAKLVKSWDKPNEGVTGISNFVSAQPRFEFFRKFLPNLKSLGVVYNPGDTNSIAILKEMETIAAKMEIDLKTAVASRTGEVLSAAQKLASEVDALFVNNDNTALAAFDSVVRAGNLAQKPIFVSDVDVVDQGALAAMGPDQYALGLQTAEMIVKIIKNPTGVLPAVEGPRETSIKINKDQAKKLKIQMDNK